MRHTRNRAAVIAALSMIGGTNGPTDKQIAKVFQQFEARFPGLAVPNAYAKGRVRDPKTGRQYPQRYGHVVWNSGVAPAERISSRGEKPTRYVAREVPPWPKQRATR